MRVFGNLSQQSQLTSFLSQPWTRLLILCGPPHLGKSSFASTALEAELHPLDFVTSDGGVDDVRSAIDFCSIAPGSSPYRAAVLVGDLSHQAQSALLKVSEEPSFGSKILLIVEDDSSLSPPLLSRASGIIRWSPLSNEEMSDFASSCSASLDHVGLCHGRPGLLRIAGRSHARLREVVLSHLLQDTRILEVPEAISDAKPSSSAERELAMIVVHDAVIAAIHSGVALSRTVPFLKFVSDMRKFPSAPADVHWWRACLSSRL